MKTKLIKLFFIAVLPIVMIVTLIDSLNASPGGITTRTYSPGETTCRECHGTFPLNTLNAGTVSIPNINTIFANGRYTPNQVYNLSITVTSGSVTPGTRYFGFGLEVLSPTSPYGNAGLLALNDANTRMYTPTVLGQVRNKLSHSNDNNPGTSRTFNFRWTAPASGQVTFHLTGLVGNGGSASGDYVIVKKYTITNI